MKCIYCGHYIQHECRINSLSYSKNLSKVNKKYIANLVLDEIKKIDAVDVIMKAENRSNYETIIKDITMKVIKGINNISNRTDINDIISFILEHAIIGFMSIGIIENLSLND